jgi:HK97 family phage prohead protease
MPLKLLSTDDFRAGAQAGNPPEGSVFRFAAGEPQVTDQAKRKVRFVFSDGSTDLAGDRIDPAGWDLSNFKRNPVALFSHMSWEPPIGRAANVVVQNGKLVGDIEFASAEVYPFADTIFRLVKGGFLKAVSVGFKPVKWALSTDRTRPTGIDFKTQQLLEISVCPVPCNPNALSEARSLGIDTRPLAAWAEKVLDGENPTAATAGTSASKPRQGGLAERMRDAREIRRSLEPRADTPRERLAEVREMRRILRAQGCLD